MRPKRALLLMITFALALCAACGWWLHRERQHYALNRQLIAALIRNNSQEALNRVNRGADPNTRLEPTPAPTLPQLLKQLLHRTPPPVNHNPTAFLLACGAFRPTTPEGDILVATREENLPLVQAMLVHGANVHVRESDKRTPLHDAVRMERLHTVELLLQRGADVNAQDVPGISPLMLTAWHMTPQVAHLLLSHGANPNEQDIAGNPALYYALLASMNKELPAELLAHGADPNLPNKNGLTPLQLAHGMKRPDLVRLLERGGRR